MTFWIQWVVCSQADAVSKYKKQHNQLKVRVCADLQGEQEGAVCQFGS